MLELSKCSSYRDVRVIEMIEVSRAGVIDMFELSRCSSNRYVRVIEMFELSRCTRYGHVRDINVFALSTIQVSQFLMFF